jgi:transcriptional regulator of NAD metabolism
LDIITIKKQQYEIIPTANGYIIREPWMPNVAINYQEWHVFESFDAMSDFLKSKYETEKL